MPSSFLRGTQMARDIVRSPYVRHSHLSKSLLLAHSRLRARNGEAYFLSSPSTLTALFAGTILISTFTPLATSSLKISRSSGEAAMFL